MKITQQFLQKWTFLSVIFAFSLLFSLLFSMQSAHAAVDICTWTGAIDNNWSNGGNWTGCDNGNVPETGDSLIFNAAAASFTPNNDLAVDINQMSVSGGISYAFSGNPLTITTEFIVTGATHTVDFTQLNFSPAAISLSTNGGDHLINSPVNFLATNIMNINLNGGGSLQLQGGLTGSTDTLVIGSNGTLGTSSVTNSNLLVNQWIQVEDSVTVNCFLAQCLADPAVEVRLSDDARIHFQALVNYAFPIAVLNHNQSTALSNNSSAITLSGGISGDGDVIFEVGNGGAITFSGANPNTFAGDMILNGGPDGLAQFFNGAQRVPNDLIVNDDILVLEPAGGSVDLVSDTSVIYLNHVDSAFWLGTNSAETIAGITGIGSLLFNDGAELVLDQADDRVFEGMIGQAAVGTGFLVKEGAGRLDLTGSCDNLGTGTSLVAEDGILAVDSANFSDCLFTLDIGELRVNGTIGAVTKSPGVGAVFSPGLSPGTATIDGNFSLTSGATYVTEIEGLTAGTQYDQTVVNGDVSLGDAILDVQHLSSFTPNEGHVFTIITFTGNLTGTFNGLANNGQLTVDGVTYRVNYNANDITLTVVEDSSSGGGSGGSSGGLPDSTPPAPSEEGEEPTPEESCAGYSDVDANDPDCEAIEYVRSIGAMTGHDNGTFGPEEYVQRDQMAKISLEAFGLFDENEDYCEGVNPFPDVLSSGWSYQYVCRGKQLGMITGYLSGPDAGLFKPAQHFILVEFWAFVLRNVDETMTAGVSFAGFETDAWYSGYAKYVADHDLHEDASPAPTDLVPRRDVARFLYELHMMGML